MALSDTAEYWRDVKGNDWPSHRRSKIGFCECRFKNPSSNDPRYCINCNYRMHDQDIKHYKKLGLHALPLPKKGRRMHFLTFRDRQTILRIAGEE